jgi:hypothetical protein
MRGARDLRRRLPGLLRDGGAGERQACQRGRRDGRADAHQQRARLGLWQYSAARLQQWDSGMGWYAQMLRLGPLCPPLYPAFFLGACKDS